MVLCHGAPLLLGAVACFGLHESQAWRLIAAAILSLYALSESAVTNSHRDFANVYCAWALALLPPGPAPKAAALGICVHFIASSGLAKLRVAGLAAWCRPDTLGGVMKTYGSLSIGDGGPGSAALNRFLVGHPPIVSLLATSTMVFEVCVVPGALALPRALQPLLTALSVGLHLGIAASQSLGIGLAFMPNLAAYSLGFGSILDASYAGHCATGDPLMHPEDKSSSLWIAVAVASLGLVPPAITGNLWAESWPCSPFALFAWSGPQWDFLFENFVRGNTRLVMTLAGLEKGALVGRRIIEKYTDKNERAATTASNNQSRSSSVSASPCVYDAWEQCLGETIIHNAILPATLKLFARNGVGDLSGVRKKERQTQKQLKAAAWSSFVSAVQTWLVAEERLMEVGTSLPMARCSFVRIKDPKNPVIAAVIA